MMYQDLHCLLSVYYSMNDGKVIIAYSCASCRIIVWIMPFSSDYIWYLFSILLYLYWHINTRTHVRSHSYDKYTNHFTAFIWNIWSYIYNVIVKWRKVILSMRKTVVIFIVLSMRKAWSGPFHPAGTFYSIQQFCFRTATALTRAQLFKASLA